MFASETENAFTSVHYRILYLPPISSEQIADLPTSILTSNHKQMKKIYNTLFSAFNFISEAAQLTFFPGKVKGLSQMQPLLVPGAISSTRI